MDELDFDKIMQGEDQAAKPKAPEAKKLNQTETRARQQSCMISEIDKDLLPSKPTTTNPAAFRVSLSDMLNIVITSFMQDKHDESLEAYKKNLLGEIREEELREDEQPEVEIIKVEVVCPDRPGGNIHMDFSKQQKHFQIKEGCVYCLRIHFLVRFDIVYGLKFVNNVYKILAKVDKEEEKMGSFAPQPQPHTFDLPWVEAPSGFLARGEYKGKGLFLDGEGIVHCQFNYTFRIASDW